MIQQDVTLGINSLGAVNPLLMCLSSVLTGAKLPKVIRVRVEGELFSLSDFYLVQLFDLARFKGVEIDLVIDRSRGVRYARDRQVELCTTKYLWMLDDDCIADYYCLDLLFRATYDNRAAYFCGSKYDVNNRRGYSDFSMKVLEISDVKENCSLNQPYHIDHCRGAIVEIWTADTGNILLTVDILRKKDIRFQIFEESYNSGGEDTLFALECRHKGSKGFFVPSAQCVHLEKPQVNFGEYAARGEMILRAAGERGYSKEDVRKAREAFMPWLTTNLATK